jgi:hypothetical protein
MSIKRPKNNRRGVILLVVLSMLTFFSVLVAAYLVFSNQSRQSSFVMANRVNHSADVNQLMNDSLMKLIRGTADDNDPFFGEDLLSDLYGRSDGRELRVSGVPNTPPAFAVGSGGFIRIPIELASTGGRVDTTHQWDDLFAGRIITFLEGPLQNQSFRILRSVWVPATGMDPARDDLLVELTPGTVATPITSTTVTPLLYPTATSVDGFRIHMNGSPLNSPGIGFNSATADTDRNATAQLAPANGLGFALLPLALQPNHLGSTTNKLQSGVPSGDFDESYDAPDFNNWFLSYRHPDGKIIPSFHRPAVINYILNERDWSGSLTPADLTNLTVSLARGTFRPLPLADGALGGTSNGIHSRFTGSNGNFALRTPISFLSTNATARIDQVAKALIGSTGNQNPWDVDNDGDGIHDSIWMDLGLPVFTSPEGKLLRPLIATMIEDLSGRLNVNAHGNSEVAIDTAGVNASALWASTRNPYANPSNVAETNPANPPQPRFRGIGYGPAEIAIPAVDSSGLITDTAIRAAIVGLTTDRLQHGRRAMVATPLPGRDGADELDILKTGYRPPRHTADVGYGFSIDPFGRAATGIGRNGSLVFASSGSNASITGTNEAIDDPYEADPSGSLSGDHHFTLADLEAIIRSNYFDLDLLPQRLRARLSRLMEQNPDFANALTTLSISADTPVISKHENASLVSIINEFGMTSPVPTNAQITQLIAPELRLGRKLDVNRPLGNGVDDNGNGVIDEPSETPNGIDNDGDGAIDESDEVESQAFAVSPASGLTVPTAYQNYVPNYAHGDLSATSGRELLARHLYVLMMGLTRNSGAFPSIGTTPFNPTEEARFRARRLAQWAVNVIDYRDSDSIMTRFNYDSNPFDGWSPPPAEVVWGVEAPELLLSEASAFHDVRVKDTTFDNDNQKDKTDTTAPDNDTDQVRIPQGSLFVELYCPRSPVDVNGNDQTTKPGVPREFYNVISSGAAQLDLAKRAPALSSGGVGAPVWRIAISEPHFGASAANAGSGNESRDPEALRTTRLDSASFEPGAPDEIDPTSPALNLERFVWFTNFADAAELATTITSNGIVDMTAQGVFFASDTINGASRFLDPGQYLTLAPRTTTSFGSYTTTGATPDRPSNQRLVSTPGEGVIHFGHDNVRRTPALGPASSYTAALPMVISTFPPSGWPATVFENALVGLNVSEPLPLGGNYYPQPGTRFMGTAGPGTSYPLTDAYIDLSIGGNTAPDEPLDLTKGRIPASLAPAAPAAPGEEPMLGTIPQYCSLFLQRLADPLSPYNATTNPYRTVDWMSVDLNVFSGEERSSKVVNASSYTRRTRQRNGYLGTSQENALYSYQTDFQTPSISIDSTALDYFALNLSAAGSGAIESSLNFLNTADAVSNPGFSGFSASIGSTGASNVQGNDRNLPQPKPFAQHPWLNRPFATHYELMMVPACSQGRLLEEFTIITNAGTNPPVYPDSASGAPDYPQVYYGPFRHLLNFFHSQTTENQASQLGRIFDLVHTLPRFRGEVKVVNPTRIAADPINSLFQPPFNIQWDNNRLGQINLNTLGSFPVWAGLMQGHMNSGEFTVPAGMGGIPGQNQLSFNEFLKSRRGYNVSAGTPTLVTGPPPYNYEPSHLDPNFPSEFAGVFRKQHEAGYAPNVRNTATNTLLTRRGVNASLLRAAGDLSIAAPAAGPSNTNPLFVRDIGQNPVSSTTNFDMDRNRNAFLRHQTLMRMPNLVSDNSQTFLIRMTLGFFEVDADTLSLGREYNEDVGQNERFQAIFIIDRSRPVGFVPGKDLNARNVVIFEKFYQ